MRCVERWLKTCPKHSTLQCSNIDMVWDAHTCDIEPDAYTHSHTRWDVWWYGSSMTPLRTSHICTPHHFLPIDTCSDCPAQHPTCGCIANVLAWHNPRAFHLWWTDHPGARTSSSSFRDLRDFLIRGPTDIHISTSAPERGSRFRNLRALHQNSICKISAGTCFSVSPTQRVGGRHGKV